MLLSDGPECRLSACGFSRGPSVQIPASRSIVRVNCPMSIPVSAQNGTKGSAVADLNRAVERWSRARLREIARRLARSPYPLTKGVRLVGVTLSNLEHASPSAALGELALS